MRYARRQVRRAGVRVHQAQRALTAAVLAMAAARERPDDDTVLGGVLGTCR